MKSREIGISARLAQTAAIFIITSVISLLVLSKASPILWEDHFQIGQNLRSTGTLTIDDVPSLLRPPGFPGFVASVLWVGDAISTPGADPSRRAAERDQRMVVSAHGLLLGAMAAALFFWASLSNSSILAAGIAVTASLNPFSLALANVASYHLLFVVMTIVSTLGLFSLRRFPSSGPAALVTGMLWGLTSLVKPVTLVIPFFVAPLMLWRLPRNLAIKSVGLVLVGMALTVAPYVTRNYLISGQPIVTAQSGFAFWGTSIEKIGPDEPFLVWQPIWWKYGMPTFTKVTGSTEYSGPLLNAHALELNAAFSNEARQNILAAPGIYLHNVMHNFISFNLDTMEFWNKFFIVHNKRLAQALSKFWIISLMMLAAAGMIWGCARRDDDAMTVTAIYLGMVIAHSISFATELYTISKLPLIILGFALLVRRLEHLPRYATPARAAACGMAGVGLLISLVAA
ncbi:MAG: hypothetical protein JWR80_601 [Bradyrhizobium sp.]|nr:hypothetical protein [Bradyrhizobium sp.]